jgi:hypothetical protein
MGTKETDKICVDRKRKGHEEITDERKQDNKVYTSTASWPFVTETVWLVTKKFKSCTYTNCYYLRRAGTTTCAIRVLGR